MMNLLDPSKFLRFYHQSLEKIKVAISGDGADELFEDTLDIKIFQISRYIDFQNF